MMKCWPEVYRWPQRSWNASKCLDVIVILSELCVVCFMILLKKVFFKCLWNSLDFYRAWDAQDQRVIGWWQWAAVWFTEGTDLYGMPCVLRDVPGCFWRTRDERQMLFQFTYCKTNSRSSSQRVQEKWVFPSWGLSSVVEHLSYFLEEMKKHLVLCKQVNPSVQSLSAIWKNCL